MEDGRWKMENGIFFQIVGCGMFHTVPNHIDKQQHTLSNVIIGVCQRNYGEHQ